MKSIDTTTLVIARTENRGEMTFQLSPSIHRYGTIAAGTAVLVRYQEKGPTHIATAITAQSPKPAGHQASSTR